MNDDPQNPFAMKARKPKVEALAAVLRQFDYTLEQVARMPEEGWVAAAALADVAWGKSADDHKTTKQMVVGYLAMTEPKERAAP